jgi:hypothetical protein
MTKNNAIAHEELKAWFSIAHEMVQEHGENYWMFVNSEEMNMLYVECCETFVTTFDLQASWEAIIETYSEDVRMKFYM